MSHKRRIINYLTSIVNTHDKKRLIGNYMSLSFLQVFSYIFTLLTIPYLVKILGTDKFGLLMFAQAFIAYFIILVDYGFNLSATKEISFHRDDKEKITEIYSSIMIIKFVLLFFSVVFMNLIIFSFDKFKNDTLLYNLTFITVIGQALFPVWFFQGLEKMKHITIINISSRFLFTILTFVFVQVETDYIYVPILTGLGSIIGSIIALYIISFNFKQKIKLYPFLIIKKHFDYSTQFFLSRVSVSIYTSSNAFVLGLYGTNEMVGYYSIASKLYTALQNIYTPISQVLYPYVAKQQNIKMFKKIFKNVVIINSFVIVLLFIFGQNIFALLFTQKIGNESIIVFHILLFASLVVVPSILLGYPFLGALGFSKCANNSVIIGSIFHIICLSILVLINNVNIYSVAFLVLFTETLVLLGRIYWVRDNLLWQRQ
jgi:PST family polysaccharide transporter